MNVRSYSLIGLLAALGLCYVAFFTDWLSPEPIQISSQIRASILQPRFGRGAIWGGRKETATGTIEKVVRTNAAGTVENGRRARLPEWGEIGDAPGDVANVTFTLDAPYPLTVVRVQDVPMDGSAPRILWDLAGHSVPTSSLLYGRVPRGMTPRNTNGTVTPLTAGAPYLLIVEAGRRKGTNRFTTRPAAGQ